MTLLDAIEIERAAREEAPALAHYGQPCGLIGLCGKRLIGVPAPPEADVCVVCQEIYNARFRAS